MRKWIGVSVVTVLTVIALRLLEPAVAWANCSLKTWSGGNVVLPTDLNSNFACLNTNLKGAGNTLITTSDIASGSITASLMATGVISRTNWTPISTSPTAVWFSTLSTCSSGTCPSAFSSGFGSVTHSSTGVYSVGVSPARPDATYAPVVNSNGGSATCVPSSLGTSSFTVSCFANSSGNPADTNFYIVLWDDE
jgi:hypothetical protein